MNPSFVALARPLLQWALLRLLRWRSAPLLPTDSEAILILSPHPDDEALGCGGLIANRREDGICVHVCYLTDGSASHPGHPKITSETLSNQRQTEARAACHELGVDSTEVTFLGAHDGWLDRLTPTESVALTEKIAHLLVRVRPNVIYLPGHADGSSEHEAAFRFLSSALGEAGITARVLEFPVWAWRDPRRLWGPLCASQVWRGEFPGQLRQKCRAIAAHRSQMEPSEPWTEPVMAREFSSFFCRPTEYYFEHR